MVGEGMYVAKDRRRKERGKVGERKRGGEHKRNRGKDSNILLRPESREKEREARE